MKSDRYFMRRALSLAKKGYPDVLPNPLVGCVITKNGKILSEGYHRSFGSAHAEVDALQKISQIESRGATLYVTLEPCTHFGKTPPCVPAILKSGITRIFIAMRDPNPKVAGQGIRILKKNGLEVSTDLLEHDAKKLNNHFIKNIHGRMPFVALKIAMSLDGKIATRTGNSKWITSESSRKYVKKIRDEFDAILVGKNTVVCDNPSLKGQSKEPIRVVLDSHFESPLSSNVFRNKRALLVTTSKAPRSKLKHLQKKGIIVRMFARKIQINPLLQYLKSIGISKLLVEGGSEIFGSFADSRMINKIYCFIAPKIIGGHSAKSSIGGMGIDKLQNSLKFKFQKMKKIETDLLIQLRSAQ